MQELYNDILGFVKQVRDILEEELQQIKDRDIQISEDHCISPVYQKRLRDIFTFLVLIVKT